MVFSVPGGAKEDKSLKPAGSAEDHTPVKPGAFSWEQFKARTRTPEENYAAVAGEQDVLVPAWEGPRTWTGGFNHTSHDAGS